MCKCVKCNQLITPRSIECKKFQKNFRFWLTLLRRPKAKKRCCHGNVFGDKFLRTWRSNVRIRPVPRKTFGWNESDRSHGQLVMSIKSAHYGKYILNKYLFFLRQIFPELGSKRGMFLARNKVTEWKKKDDRFWLIFHKLVFYASISKNQIEPDLLMFFFSSEAPTLSKFCS